MSAVKTWIRLLMVGGIRAKDTNLSKMAHWDKSLSDGVWHGRYDLMANEFHF